MLTPGGAFVVYTRQGRGRSLRGYDINPACATEPQPDELRQINVDGTGDKVLLTGRKGDARTTAMRFSRQAVQLGRTAALFPHAGLGHVRRVACL